MKLQQLFILVLGVLLIACAKKPKYSNVPQISFKSFDVLTRDTAFFNINFSDGDGDIGGSTNGVGNIYITYYFWDKDSNKYDLYADTTFYQDTIDVRTFPEPSDAYKGKPINGEITTILIGYRPNYNIKKMKLTAYIKDNAGNKSNIVKTPDLYVP